MWNFKSYATKEALHTKERTYSYRDLDRMQEKFSSLLQQRSLVCIGMENKLGCFVAYISCIQNGHVPILLPAGSDRSYWQTIIKKYKPRYLVGKCELTDEYVAKAEIYGCTIWERCHHYEVNMNQKLALLLPTSGSTQSPKMVRICYDNLRSNTESICEYMSLDEKDCSITSLPLSYTYGLSVVNTLLWVGGRLVLTEDSVMQSSFWCDMNQYGVTMLAGVPYTYLCMKKLGIHISKYRDLRLLTQAGGKLSDLLQEFWGKEAQNNGKSFLIMYGQTEATARISYLPAKECLRKIGSVGIPIPKTEVCLQDEKGLPIKESSRLGEIVSKGAHISMGYAESFQDLRKGDENAGELPTGDMGYWDEEGYLYIAGRKSRFAKIYGKRINLDDIEKLLRDDYEGEIAVISDDERIYVLTEEEQIGQEREELCCKVGLPHQCVKVKRVTSIPRKENGKIDYMKIKEELNCDGYENK